MLYMLTATEIVFIKDLIEELNEYYDDLTGKRLKGVDTALELLNRIEPIETEAVLNLLDSIEEEEYGEYD